MKRLIISGSSGDRKGMLIAAICFIHCVLGPLLLSFAGLTSLVGLSEIFESVFLLSSLALGSATLLPAYRKKHRRLSCLALFVLGLTCLLLLRHARWLFLPEAVIVGIGATLIVGAHALNLKFSRECQCCSSEESQEQRAEAARGPE